MADDGRCAGRRALLFCGPIANLLALEDSTEAQAVLARWMATLRTAELPQAGVLAVASFSAPSPPLLETVAAWLHRGVLARDDDHPTHRDLLLAAATAARKSARHDGAARNISGAVAALLARSAHEDGAVWEARHAAAAERAEASWRRLHPHEREGWMAHHSHLKHEELQASTC